ncbi:MAG: hypothetical protein GY856_36985 [bacterium]|nr:hypothetical protein [bacterium]
MSDAPDPTTEIDDSPAEKVIEEVNAAKLAAGLRTLEYVAQALEGAARGAETAAQQLSLMQTATRDPNPVAAAQQSIRIRDARATAELLPGLYRAVEIVRSIKLVPKGPEVE